VVEQGHADAGVEAAQENEAGDPEIVIEVLTWVNRLVGGTGSGSVVMHERLAQEDTVESALRRFSARYPALREALWTRDGGMTDNLHIMVNHKMIGATHTLRSRLAVGDTISLLGQFSGG
jgi:molybdopterin converting factor small subunit